MSFRGMPIEIIYGLIFLRKNVKGEVSESELRKMFISDLMKEKEPEKNLDNVAGIS